MWNHVQYANLSFFEGNCSSEESNTGSMVSRSVVSALNDLPMLPHSDRRTTQRKENLRWSSTVGALEFYCRWGSTVGGVLRSPYRWFTGSAFRFKPNYI
ncbi:hypothetical protein DAPPUDRAFT_257256 [Daphnia pulex]|uniref:Uncharacterized protein n=1 Tax=Daphnia pulex TaxID=6669 RepID=E9HD71_DAPPU|nr:hypothetical protein DAPPUDRAFT_257256 [Daphnia pulex]|eukprot:EFX70315.1 hypothetical protein DAPPUDRAFT_257256 [Daphnia pulex]